MKVELNRVNKTSHYTAESSSSSIKVNIDGPSSIGGEEKGVRPMELVLMALGSCSAFDLVEILRKQRQEIDDIKIEVEGERREKIPKVFTKIHLKFYLKGNNINIDKAKKASELAIKKYCSVHDMLVNGGVDISYEIIL